MCCPGATSILCCKCRSVPQLKRFYYHRYNLMAAFHSVNPIFSVLGAFECGFIITGGAGFIGSAVVRLPIAQGYEVVNVDALTYAANLENVAAVAGSPHYVFEHVDIRDRPALDRVFRGHEPDAVIHLAAESHVDRSIDRPSDFIGTGTFNLFKAARSCWTSAGKPDNFRFISTDEVFGSLGADGQFSEETPYDPRSPYAASKAASDWHFERGGSTQTKSRRAPRFSRKTITALISAVSCERTHQYS